MSCNKSVWLHNVVCTKYINWCGSISHKVYQLVWLYFTQSIPTCVDLFHTKYTNLCGSISHKVYQLVWICFTQNIPTGVDLFHTRYTNGIKQNAWWHKLVRSYVTQIIPTSCNNQLHVADCKAAWIRVVLCYIKYINVIFREWMDAQWHCPHIRKYVVIVTVDFPLVRTGKK